MTLFAFGLAYLGLLLLLAVVSAAETAVLTSRELTPRVLAGQSEEIRRQVQSITSNPFPHLHRALLLSAALNLALAALGLFLVVGPLREMGWNPWISAPILFGFTVLAADMAPKFFAIWSPSSILLRTIKILNPLRVVLDPLLVPVERASDLIVRALVPKRVKMRLPITQEELETLIEMREEQGVLDPVEAAIIREILEVAELTVRDCMTPRINLPLMPIGDSREEAARILDGAESRFVVVHGDTPDVVHGVIDTQAWKLAGRPDVMTWIKPPVYVPETLPALEALEKHLRNPSACVLIVDEYGGLEGLVSQEEIVDWLLYDAAPWQGEGGEIRDLGDGRYLLDGATRLDHMEDEIGLKLAADGIDTVGGYVFNQLGHLPKPGERLAVEGADIKVRRLSRISIQQVELRLHEPPAIEEEEE